MCIYLVKVVLVYVFMQYGDLGMYIFEVGGEQFFNKIFVEKYGYLCLVVIVVVLIMGDVFVIVRYFGFRLGMFV